MYGFTASREALCVVHRFEPSSAAATVVCKSACLSTNCCSARPVCEAAARVSDSSRMMVCWSAQVCAPP